MEPQSAPPSPLQQKIDEAFAVLKALATGHIVVELILNGAQTAIDAYLQKHPQG